MALTALAVRQAKPAEKPYKLFDERGLFLLVTPSGSKLWRFKYQFDKKEKQISFGAYPDISLAQARIFRADAKKELISGINPSDTRKEKRTSAASDTATFEVVAREWLAEMSVTWANSHYTKVVRRLEREIFPKLGNWPIGDIGPRDLLSPLKAIVSRGNRETARRVKQTFEYFKVIKSNWSVFEDIFLSRSDLEQHFKVISEFRNALAHNREVDAVARLLAIGALGWFDKSFAAANS